MIRALALVAVLAAAPAGAQDSLVLTPAQMRDLTLAALNAGNPDAAQAYALALLARDPADSVGLAVLAQLALADGQTRSALQHAAQLFAVSDGAARAEAARMAALAAAREGRWLLANLWLRRAMIAAPDDATRAALRADGADLRRSSPVRATFGFGIAPSDNVTNGSEEGEVVINGLLFRIPVEERALSGVAATLDFGLERVMAESATRRTTLEFRLSAREVWLSDEADALIARDTPATREPATGEDFSTASARLGLTQDWALGVGVLTTRATLIRAWEGRALDYDALALAAEWTRQRDNGQRIGAEAQVEWRDLPKGGDDQRRLTLSADWRVIRPNGDALTLGVVLQDVDSANSLARTQTRTVQASYALDRPVGPFGVEFLAGYQVTTYPDFQSTLLGFDERRDDRLFGTLSLSMAGWEYAGFVPVMNLSYERLNSNFVFSGREGFGVDLALRSSF